MTALMIRNEPEAPVAPVALMPPQKVEKPPPGTLTRSTVVAVCVVVTTPADVHVTPSVAYMSVVIFGPVPDAVPHTPLSRMPV